MKKRVAFARALISEPAIVLFDEPTTGLDPVITSSIHELIKGTHKKYGYTGVIISHEVPRIFEITDKIAMLHNGVIKWALKFKFHESIVRQFMGGSHEGL
jgi:phospholipid/cholesterol/gamma-HCH transport system ATP-binding protein